jgi:hypothetical protein
MQISVNENLLFDATLFIAFFSAFIVIMLIAFFVVWLNISRSVLYKREETNELLSGIQARLMDISKSIELSNKKLEFTLNEIENRQRISNEIKRESKPFFDADDVK